jgi:hypothetical protein
MQNQKWWLVFGGVLVIRFPLGGIGFDLEPGQFEILLVADDVFVVIALPQSCHRPTFHGVDFFGGLILEIRDDLPQLRFP